MSVPERDVRFTPAARRDLRNIALYTRRIWGIERQASYRAALERAFKLISEHPQLGRPRDDFFSGCRGLRVEQHVIYFHQPRPDEIEVLRILHQRQDTSAVVKDPRS